MLPWSPTTPWEFTQLDREFERDEQGELSALNRKKLLEKPREEW